MIPWWSKIGAKLVLSRLPFDYRFWSQRVGIFRHGRMNQGDYALKVYSTHFESCRPAPGFTCLELGPGDALASAVLTRAFGGERAILVDVARFATDDMDVYRGIAATAAAQGYSVPDVAGAKDMQAMLGVCHAEYVTNGLASLKALPSASCDFMLSQSCLEHVRHSEFEATVHELRRVMKPDGCASHRVDLMDHLARNLNNLRFADFVWESDFMASSGFYTNRIRYEEMLSIFRNAGFSVEITELYHFDADRIPREKMQDRFRALPEDDLNVSAFTMRCRPI